MAEWCVVCGSSEASERIAERTVMANGSWITIPDDRFMHCTQCGEDYYTGEQSRESMRKVVSARRQYENLLSSEEIRKIRQSLQLTQRELENVLGVGEKTVARWENGTSVQSKALDDVLRLIRLDPDNLRLLVRVRDVASWERIELKITSQLLRKSAELNTAVFAAFERARELTPTTDWTMFDSDVVRLLSETIVKEIRTYKEEKIKSITTTPREMAI